MPLHGGNKLGPYELIAKIGAGGMGEVWKARDTRLDRVVAIKVSKTEFSQRFEREARTIAALNNPNICQIYDVGPNYLVMEFIDGSELKGPMPVERAIPLASQILDALDAAHRKAIVHRDLKPANILVTRAGVKVLDFGLAKMERAQSATVAADAPTAITVEGTIAGTLYYMAPEQLQGKEVDSRADIFAFGCVLYEMLTGKRAFDGSNAASVIAAVMERPAPSISEVAPAALDRVLQRCLAKDLDERWQSVRDLKAALGLALAPAVAVTHKSALWPGPIFWIAATVVLGVVAALAGWNWWRQSAPDIATQMRFAVDAPPDTDFRSVYFSSSISPDGHLLVYSAQRKGVGSTPKLWLREMNSLTSRELAGTDNGNGSFWSPDSKSIGFEADGKLKRIDIASGSVQIICEDQSGFEGGSWNQKGVILFGTETGGIQRVSAAGGVPAALTGLDRKGASVRTGALSHRYPHFLPDGRNFLYTHLGALDSSGIYIASLEHPKEAARLMQSDARADYAPSRNGLPGHLFWLRDQALMTQRFDPKSRRLEGDAVAVADGVAAGFAANGRRAAFSVSSTGVLAYRGGGNSGFELTWINREGIPVAAAPSESFSRGGDPSISPDGRRVSMERQTGQSMQVWLYESGRGIMTRLTLDAGFSWFPIWSPDGRQVAYSANRGGSWGIYRTDADGGGKEELLLAAGAAGGTPTTWSKDGRFLLYESGDNQAYGTLENQDIFMLPLTGSAQERRPVPYVQSPFRENNAQFSPDGKWVAYQSNESGRDEVYIQAFPSTGAKWQVSNNEGLQPRWRGDGRELFFISDSTQRMWVAGIRASQGGVEIETPHSLFPVLQFPGPGHLYDVTADGQRFVIVSPSGAGASASLPINIVSEWQTGLKK
jgi:eukaryotic-like serine/threonine-protein kinase